MSLDPALPISALLAWRDAETRRWREWFASHPTAAFDAPVGRGSAETVRGLVRHIFAVEMRYAQRLLGLPVSEPASFTQQSLAEIFALGDEARRLLDQYLATVTQSSLDEVLTFATMTAGTIVASKRKILFNLVPHGMRHWAQIASYLRQAGYGDGWPHDFLAADVGI